MCGLPLSCPLLGTWPATQTYALTRSRTRDPLVQRPALNPLSHTSQGYFSIFDQRVLIQPDGLLKSWSSINWPWNLWILSSGKKHIVSSTGL